jgi:hypothetical protein
MKLSLREEQRGLSTVAVAAVVLVIAVAGLVAWRVSDNNGKSPAAVANKAAFDNCNRTYKDRNLCQFIANYDLSRLSYKLVINSVDTTKTVGSNTPVGNSTTTILSDGKGNSNVIGSSSGKESSVIFLKKVAYLKDPADGKWWKYGAKDQAPPSDTNPLAAIKFSSTAAKAKVKSTISYKKLANEACGSLTCFKYQITDSAHPTATSYVWFDTKDYRLQGYYTKEGNITTDLQLAYLPVTISAPSPTKDFNATLPGAQSQLQTINQTYTGSNPGASPQSPQ